MPLTCLVTVEMVRPGTPQRLYSSWKKRREQGDTVELPASHVRTWRGLPESRDWDRLVAFKQRDSWGLISHRREFVNSRDDVVDSAEDA